MLSLTYKSPLLVRLSWKHCHHKVRSPKLWHGKGLAYQRPGPLLSIYKPKCHLAVGCPGEPFRKGSASSSSGIVFDKLFRVLQGLLLFPAGSLGLVPILSWFPPSPGRTGLSQKLLGKELYEVEPRRTLSMGNKGTWGQYSISRCSQEHQIQSVPCPPQAEAPEWKPEETAGGAHTDLLRPGLRIYCSYRQIHSVSMLTLAIFCMWVPSPCRSYLCIQSGCSVPSLRFCLPAHVPHFLRPRG